MGVSRTRGSRSPGGQGMFVQYPGTCTAIFGSMTQTLHAQSSLAAASIRTAVTKISSAQINIPLYAGRQCPADPCGCRHPCPADIRGTVGKESA